MYFGYVKDNSLLDDEADYNRVCAELKVDRVYVDRYGDSTALSDLIKYVRAGDYIVIRDTVDVSRSTIELVELLLTLHSKSVFLVCLTQKIDTSDSSWVSVLNILNNLSNDMNISNTCQQAGLLEELDTYFLRVKNKELTVDEVCKKLKIGRSTYYRRWHMKYQKPERERHPELFDQYEEKVALGEITVRDACKEMGIGITTYYNMRKQHK